MASRSHYLHKKINVWTIGCGVPKEPSPNEPPILIMEWDLEKLEATDPSTHPWSFCWLSDKLVAEVVKKVNINKRKNITLDFDVNGHVKRTRPSFGPAANAAHQVNGHTRVYDYTYRNYYRLKGEISKNESPLIGKRTTSNSDGYELFFHTKKESAYGAASGLLSSTSSSRAPRNSRKKFGRRARQVVAPLVMSGQSEDIPEQEEATEASTDEALEDAEYEESEASESDEYDVSENDDNSILDDVPEKTAFGSLIDPSLRELPAELEEEESEALASALTEAFTTSAAAQALVTQQFKAMANIAQQADKLTDNGCRYILKCLLSASQNCYTMASQVSERLPDYAINGVPERYRQTFIQACQAAETNMAEMPLNKVSFYETPAKHYNERLTEVLGRVMDLEGEHFLRKPVLDKEDQTSTRDSSSLGHRTRTNSSLAQSTTSKGSPSSSLFERTTKRRRMD